MSRRSSNCRYETLRLDGLIEVRLSSQSCLGLYCHGSPLCDHSDSYHLCLQQRKRQQQREIRPLLIIWAIIFVGVNVMADSPLFKNSFRPN